VEPLGLNVFPSRSFLWVPVFGEVVVAAFDVVGER
jgi:hypothetical protein